MCLFAFSTSWLHSALLVQQTCLLQNKGSRVVLHHQCTVPISTKSTATHTPMVFPTCFQVWQHAGLCVLLHTVTCHSDCCCLSDPRRQQSSRTLILMGSDSRLLSFYHSLAATFALGNHRSLGDPRTCLLALSAPLQTSRSCHSSLLSNPLVCLVDWWVKIFVG